MPSVSALALVYVFLAAPAVGLGERGASTVPSPQPGATHSPEEMRSAVAKQLYSEQRYVESARAYEALYSEFGDPKYLFNAAVAHEGSGQDAHAYVALRRFLDHPGLSAEDQARGEARLAPLRRRTAPLQLEIAPSPRPVGLELELRRPGIEPLRFDADTFVALDRRGVLELHAEPGNWSVLAQAPGYRNLVTSLQQSAVSQRRLLQLEAVATGTTLAATSPRPGQLRIGVSPKRALRGILLLRMRNSEKTIEHALHEPETALDIPGGRWTIGLSSQDFISGSHIVDIRSDRPQQISLRLERTAQSKQRIGLTFGIGALSAVTFVIGTALTASSESQYDSTLNELTNTLAPIGQTLPPERKMAFAKVHAKVALAKGGEALLGGATGLAIVSITEFAQPRRNLPFYLEAGVGALALTGGALGLALGVNPALRDIQRRSVASTFVGQFNDIRSGRIAASLFLGAGMGLISGAVSTIVVRHLLRHRQRDIRK